MLTIDSPFIQTLSDGRLEIWIPVRLSGADIKTAEYHTMPNEQLADARIRWGFVHRLCRETGVYERSGIRFERWLFNQISLCLADIG
jgi:hypothetical protein